MCVNCKKADSHQYYFPIFYVTIVFKPEKNSTLRYLHVLRSPGFIYCTFALIHVRIRGVPI